MTSKGVPRSSQVNTLVDKLGADVFRSLPESQLRLFFSADLVGSTAFKQRTNKSNGEKQAEPWLHTFTGFYTDIGDRLRAEWMSLRGRLHTDLGERLGKDFARLTQDALPLQQLSSPERRYRRVLDKYDEKKVLLLEAAESKW
jgi:hypothetical protein